MWESIKCERDNGHCYENCLDIAMKIVCSIRARSLQRRLFRTHLEEAEAEHTDLLLHTDVRWLSRGRFLERFRELLPEIKVSQGF